MRGGQASLVRERRADRLRRVSWLADAECQCERGPRSYKYGIHPRGPHRTSITENEQDMSTVDGSTQGDKRRQAIKDVQYQRKQRGVVGKTRGIGRSSVRLFVVPPVLVSTHG